MPNYEIMTSENCCAMNKYVFLPHARPTKSEFSCEIEHKLVVPPPSEVPVLGKRIKTAIVIDFMAYARRVPVNLTTYGRLSVICQGTVVALI